jgi:hypothetical protein
MMDSQTWNAYSRSMDVENSELIMSGYTIFAVIVGMGIESLRRKVKEYFLLRRLINRRDKERGRISRDT